MYKSKNTDEKKEQLVNEIRDNLNITMYEFYKLQDITSYGTIKSVISNRRYRSININKLIKLRDLSIEILEKEENK